jgi:hypothetical protein
MPQHPFHTSGLRAAGRSARPRTGRGVTLGVRHPSDRRADRKGILMDTSGIIAWFFWMFVAVAYLMVVLQVFADLFRDHELSGWGKAAWILFILFVPFIAVVVYLIARGSGMSARQTTGASHGAREDSVTGVAGHASVSPANRIADAEALLADGAITQAEFDRLKAEALA